MNPAELRELIQELVQAVTLAMQSGEQLPDEFLAQIAQTLELMYNRLEETEGAGIGGAPNPPPEGPPDGDLTQAMPSSNVDAFSYDDRTGQLYVRFLGQYPNRHGAVYSYDNVPAQMFDLLRRGAVPAKTDGRNRWGRWWRGKSPSMGSSVNVLLKQGGFNYRRVG